MLFGIELIIVVRKYDKSLREEKALKLQDNYVLDEITRIYYTDSRAYQVFG